MKSTGDLYTPLMILKGPRGTGKTTLGEIFTYYMYSIESGDPSDATSDSKEIWRINLNENGSQVIYCDPTGVSTLR